MTELEFGDALVLLDLVLYLPTEAQNAENIVMVPWPNFMALLTAEFLTYGP